MNMAYINFKIKSNTFYFLLLLGILSANSFGISNFTKLSHLTSNRIQIPSSSPNQEGDIIPDFSYCGYKASNQPIPDCPVTVVLSPLDGDNTERIQTALNYVASLPMDSAGIRGVVMLRKGTYHLLGGLQINSSGVILRGQDTGDNGTVLIAAGTDRRTLLRFVGTDDRTWTTDAPHQITDEFVRLGAVSFHVNDTTGLKIGDSISITRPATQEWINEMGMDSFGGGKNGYFAWKPGSRNIVWDRTVTDVNDLLITIDVPLTLSVDTQTTLQPYTWPGRISNVGVENLTFRSQFNPDNPKDEEHSWTAITMENIEDAWVRQCTFEHFAASAVSIWQSCRRITVEDCLSLEPVSEHGGYRRHTFFTMGQQTLFLRCFSQEGRHDFSVGHCAAGPNAFVQCQTSLSLDDSGPIESWACGVLYDNVRIDGNALRLANRGSRGEGIGWSAGNSLLWQCHAAVIECDKPPTTWNWSIGCWGEFEGKGFWYETDSFINPFSLYVAQLNERLGSKAPDIPLMQIGGDSTSSPTIEVAAAMNASGYIPAPSLRDYIMDAPRRHSIPTDTSNSKEFDMIHVDSNNSEATHSHRITLTDGFLVCDDQLVIGGIANVAWWRGNIRPDKAPSYGLGVTRFVPGRIGPGYIDDLEVLTDGMIARGQAVLEHNYGLWYDRRRDDHERVRRMNGNVRPPFYEQPFARSGIGTAWDGLSKYDLTKYNTWYWQRLAEFVDLCDQKGLALIHHNYFQHNILEAGGHWVDSPWRPVNNINETGFPEPPNFAGDKRIFLDEQFYDTTHPVRAPLHRAYIRKCMENFSDNTNVIQEVSEEYTGPLEFTQFWLDTIIEWKQETNKEPLIALDCTKDVQDRILADPQRSPAVSVIDIRYWWYQGNGDLYAPEGGKHLAPRQYVRLMHPRNTSFSQVVRAIRQYRTQYPDKAVIYTADTNFGWAVLMGTGSIPNLPKTTDSGLLRAVVKMKPYDLPTDSQGQYALYSPDQGFLVYAESGQSSVSLDLSNIRTDFVLNYIDLRTGQLALSDRHIESGRLINIELRRSPCMLWLKPK